MKYIKVNKSTKNKSKSKKTKTKGGNKIDDKIDNTSDINNFIINFYNKIVPTNIYDNINDILKTKEGKLIQNIAIFISNKIKDTCYETINKDGFKTCMNIYELLLEKKTFTEIIESYIKSNSDSDSAQILQLLKDYYNLPDTTPTPIPNNTKELSKEDKIFEVIKSITKNINDIITYIHQQRSTHKFDFNPLLKDTKCSDKLKIENPIDFINGLEFILKDLEKKSVGTTSHIKQKQPETTINDDDDAKKYEGVLYTPSFEY